MKKKLSIVLILVLLLSLLCGCGASAKTEAADMAYATEEMMYEAKAESGFGGNWAQTAPAAAPMEPKEDAAYEIDLPEAESQSTGLPANVKLIYTANLELESTVFEQAVGTVEEMVSSCGGYFENSDMNNYGRYRSVNYTIRVPAAQFNWFCDTLSALSAEGEVLQMRNISRSAQDVSEAYYDIESRLATQKTKLERLQNLLKKAEIMEDIIELESAISDTELTIEQLTGSLRRYDSLVGYSTIYIYLSEVYKLTEVEEPVIGFWPRLAAAFQSGCYRFVDNLQDLALGFARGWVGWLIFLIIVVIVILIIRRSVRKEKVRREEKKNRQAEEVARRAAERSGGSRKPAPAPTIPEQIPTDEKPEE